MRLALAQINTVVGDLEGNRDRVLARFEEARGEGADLVLVPELAVTGYPPEDLLLRPGFVRAARKTVEQVAAAAKGLSVLVGATICEDVWQPGPPATDLALAGAELIANISASPFHVGKDREREEMLATRARDNSVFLAFCNAVGGQDELIFDGHSLVLDDEGTVLARAPGFEECLLLVDVEPTEVVARRLRDVRRRALARERGIPQAEVVHVGSPRPSPDGKHLEPPIAEPLDDLEQMRLALELGLRDYVEKNGFREIVVGVSGSIDSALMAAIAA